jgi:membrane associated rhomboid family serine protease
MPGKEVDTNEYDTRGVSRSKARNLPPLQITPAETSEGTAEPIFVVINDETKDPEIWTGAEVEQNRRFNHALATSPRLLITASLILINAAVFVAMIVRGLSFLHPDTASLVKWGADYGPLTTHGQWWRIITSVFLHSGFAHLAPNMFFLLLIGNLTERLFGRFGFSVLYLGSGVGSSIASLMWHPFAVSAGASGAIFGLYGGLLAFLLTQRRVVPRHRIWNIAKSALLFLVVNLIDGLHRANVNVAAHLGGLVAGFLLGWGLSCPPTPVEPRLRFRKSLAVALTGTAVAAGLATLIRPT